MQIRRHHLLTTTRTFTAFVISSSSASLRPAPRGRAALPAESRAAASSSSSASLRPAPKGCYSRMKWGLGFFSEGYLLSLFSFQFFAKLHLNFGDVISCNFQLFPIFQLVFEILVYYSGNSAE